MVKIKKLICWINFFYLIMQIRIFIFLHNLLFRCNSFQRCSNWKIPSQNTQHVFYQNTQCSVFDLSIVFLKFVFSKFFLVVSRWISLIIYRLFSVRFTEKTHYIVRTHFKTIEKCTEYYFCGHNGLYIFSIKDFSASTPLEKMHQFEWRLYV